MATSQHGGVRRATANTVSSMANGAEQRRCPKCNRKSALKHHSDDLMSGWACRYADCGYEKMTLREWEGE